MPNPEYIRGFEECMELVKEYVAEQKGMHYAPFPSLIRQLEEALDECVFLMEDHING